VVWACSSRATHFFLVYKKGRNSTEEFLLQPDKAVWKLA
jgi:hypothetical protein